MFHSNRMKRSYDFFCQAASVFIHAGLAANAFGRPAGAPQSLVYFMFVVVRTTLVIALIIRSSPWFLHHRSRVFACSQVLAAIMYFTYVLRVPQMLMDGTAFVQNRLPASGTLARTRFLLLLPMLELHVSFILLISY